MGMKPDGILRTEKTASVDRHTPDTSGIVVPLVIIPAEAGIALAPR